MNNKIKYYIISLLLFFFASSCVANKHTANQLAGEQLSIMKEVVNNELRSTTFKNIIFYEKQSFCIEYGADSKISMLTGKGAYDSLDAGFVDSCFVGFHSSNGADYVIFTIGVGNWEATSCNELLAVGFIESENNFPPKILLLYSAQSPNFESKPAILLSWNKKSSRYEIEEKTSALLDNATDRTITGLKQILNKIRR
jgi:hypothetical protein